MKNHNIILVQSRKSFNHENPSQITMYLSYVGRKSWILANILIRWTSSYDKTSLAKISRIQALLLAERSLRVVTAAVLVQSLGDTPHVHETWTLNYVAMSTNHSVDNTVMSTFFWLCSVLCPRFRGCVPCYVHNFVVLFRAISTKCR